MAEPTTGLLENGADETRRGFYVYGIMSADASLPAKALTVDAVDPAHPTLTLSHQDIQAIVGIVSLDEFGQQELSDHLHDADWVAAKVRAHEAVVEELCTHGAVVPMRFGTIFCTEIGVRDMLAEHQGRFRAALVRVAGKREWGVKVYFSRQRGAEAAATNSPAVRELKALIAEQTPGMAYFSQKRLQDTTMQEVDRAIDECSQRTHERLAEHAEDAVLNALRSKEVTGRDEEMILNAAYLVADDRLAAFKAELESIMREYAAAGFVHEPTGPWPPYSFVEVA